MILKKDVTPQVKRSIEALHLGGIVWGELSSERLYADGDLMGALLGGVNDNGDGVAGIEQVENKTLTGTDGHETYQRGNGRRRDSRHHDRIGGGQKWRRCHPDH